MEQKNNLKKKADEFKNTRNYVYASNYRDDLYVFGEMEE